MVGHTGVFEAAVAACETVDTCVGDVVSTAISHGYDVLLTADHGNSDLIIVRMAHPTRRIPPTPCRCSTSAAILTAPT